MPEHNLIQRPDLMHRVQAFLGLRQAHIAPTINDGVQLVMVVGDLREEKGSGRISGAPATEVHCRAVVNMPAGGAGVFNQCKLRNPLNSFQLGTNHGRVIEMLDAYVVQGGDTQWAVQADTGDFPTGITEAITDVTTLPPGTVGVIGPIAGAVTAGTAGSAGTPVPVALYLPTSAAGTSAVVDLSGITFPANFQLSIAQQTANVALILNLHWIERIRATL